MNDLRTAAQQALEALDISLQMMLPKQQSDQARRAAYALRAALTEPVQEPVAVSERERWAFLLRAAGRVLQAFDDGYLQPDSETLQGSVAVDALRESWAAFAPVRIQGPNCMAAPPQRPAEPVLDRKTLLQQVARLVERAHGIEEEK